MRKDVKLGLAVGGVLLAVLVVYVLVVPGNNANEAGALLETVEGSESQVAGAAGMADGGAVASNDDGTSVAVASEQGGEPVQDQQANAGGASSDVDSANTPATSGEEATADTSGGWNWDALVNGTEKVPSLIAQTEVSSNGATAGDDRAAAGTDTTGTDTEINNATGNEGAGSANDVIGSANVIVQAPTNAPLTTDDTRPRTPQPLDPAPTSIAQDPPAAATAGARTHVVKAGDTYSKISSVAYGTSKYYVQIEHANPGIDPTRLKPGMTINLPAIDAKPAATLAAARQQQETIDPRTQYKVQPNDSLYTISLRLYGKADRVEKLYELNKAAIGDDMARVKVGMVLTLPEAPTQTTAAASTR